jgi:hypothetical protein
MRAGITVSVTPDDRRRLEAIVSDRNAPQKHVWRAQIILATADGCGTTEIMRRSGKSKPVVWTWQARFMAEGVDGLRRDKTRKPGKPPLPAATVQRVLDLALGPPPGEATHWTGRMLAKAVTMRARVFLQTAHSAQRLDCLAGHIGFEPANPSARYLIGIARQLRLRWAQSGWRRSFARQLHGAHCSSSQDCNR